TITFVEAKVVDEQHERLRPPAQVIQQEREPTQLLHGQLDEAQAPRTEPLEQAAYRRRLAAPTRTVEKRVVRRPPLDERLGVGHQLGELLAEPHQVGQRCALRRCDGPQAAAHVAQGLVESSRSAAVLVYDL